MKKSELVGTMALHSRMLNIEFEVNHENVKLHTLYNLPGVLVEGGLEAEGSGSSYLNVIKNTVILQFS